MVASAVHIWKKKTSSKEDFSKKLRSGSKDPAPVETPKVETPKVEASVVEPADELSEISNDFSNLITQLRSAQSMYW